jgi:hypothetical protein
MKKGAWDEFGRNCGALPRFRRRFAMARQVRGRGEQGISWGRFRHDLRFVSLRRRASGLLVSALGNWNSWPRRAQLAQSKLTERGSREDVPYDHAVLTTASHLSRHSEATAEARQRSTAPTETTSRRDHTQPF